MSDHKETDEIEITIEKESYSNPSSEFMYTRGQEIASQIAERAATPKTVKDALITRALRQNLTYAELIDEVIDRHPDWKTAPIESLIEAYATQALDQSTTREIGQNTAMIEAITRQMTEFDSSQIQLAIVKNKKGRGEYAYTYLVLYPPDPETGQRVSQASYPTAMCHLVDANSLLTQSRLVNVADQSYDVSFNQTHAISDEELHRIVTETGKTPLDKVIQAGLAIIDQLKNRQGEHIDPISAITNRDYAVKYALATHRGVGLVDNERINLPPVSSNRNPDSQIHT